MPRRQTSDIGASRFSHWQEALCVIAITFGFARQARDNKADEPPLLCLVTYSARHYSTKVVMALAREVGQELTDKQIQDIAAAGDHWKDKKSCKSHVPLLCTRLGYVRHVGTDFMDY